ncbi:hypothetical protein CSB69_2767 [Morganella morganii]|nr:hypothetical protein CSB69_2767 [Morganella morganii]EMP53181.1 hypothetical protein C790_03157 [Morganella morganii SC01]
MNLTAGKNILPDKETVIFLPATRYGDNHGGKTLQIRVMLL